MTKAPFDDADVASGLDALTVSSRDRRTPQVFDERGRTVAWMARTVHRLYNAQAQTILDEEKVTIAHWFYLRILAQHGEINQLELSKRVGMASASAVPALDNMEKRGLLLGATRRIGANITWGSPIRGGVWSTDCYRKSAP